MKDFLRTRIVCSGDTVEVIEYSSGIACGKQRPNRRSPEDREEVKRIDNLHRARQNVRRIVWSNITGKHYVKLLTLTYKETILDTKKVKYDIQIFVKQMRRYGYPMNYLYVLEHQSERGKKEGNAGCLHIHMFIFDDLKIDLEHIKKSWKHGQDNLRVIRDLKNAGAYICKYITKENYAEFGQHCYGVSRGLDRPVEEKFYEEGYTDSLLDGVRPRDILNGLDVSYSSKCRHDYFDQNGVMQTQTVKYTQGKWKDKNLLETLKAREGIYYDSNVQEYYDSRVLDEILEQFRVDLESEKR